MVVVLERIHTSSQKLTYEVTVSVSSSRSAQDSTTTSQSVQSEHPLRDSTASEDQIFTDLFDRFYGYQLLCVCWNQMNHGMVRANKTGASSRMIDFWNSASQRF